MSKRNPFKVGDLVRITMLGSMHYGKAALVLDRVQYTRLNPHEYPATFTSDDHTHVSLTGDDGYVPHPDEYSCRLQLINPDPDELNRVMIRAKWLERLSSVEEAKA